MSDEELEFGEEELELGSPDESDDDGEQPHPSKRRRLEDARIENAEEAEASLLELEVRLGQRCGGRAVCPLRPPLRATLRAQQPACSPSQVGELLAEAGVDPAAEGAVVALAKAVGAHLAGLPEAEVARTAAKGFLRDLSFALTVGGWAGGRAGGAERALWWGLPGGCWGRGGQQRGLLCQPCPLAPPPGPAPDGLTLRLRPGTAEALLLPATLGGAAGGQLCSARRRAQQRGPALPGPGAGDAARLLRPQGPAQPQVGGRGGQGGAGLGAHCVAAGGVGALPAPTAPGGVRVAPGLFSPTRVHARPGTALRRRYHAKRALYLAHVAGAVRGLPGVERVSLSTLCNDPR